MHRRFLEGCGLALSFAAGAATSAAQQCHQELTPDAVGADDSFGTSVAADGDRAVVGALEVGSNGAGAVYVLELGATGWTSVAELRANDAQWLDRFGASVALNGDVVAIGAPGHDGGSTNAGAVYVFRRGGLGWIEEQRLFAPNPGSQASLGWSTALEGDLLVSGSQFDDDLGTSSGSAHVFHWNGASWVHR